MVTFRKSFGHYVENVKPGLWRIVFHLPTTTNCYLLQEGDGLTLVDAGSFWNAGTILDTISAIGKPLRQIVITHAHPDHAGSAALLAKETGAAVNAHKADVPMLQGKESMADLPGSLESRSLHKAARTVGILEPPRIGAVNPLQDGESVGSLKVLHTPGHTPGSISLWCEKDEALFVGDNASYRCRQLKSNFSWFTLNSGELKKSLQTYSNYPASMLLPGHGNVYRSNNVVRDLLNSVPA